VVVGDGPARPALTARAHRLGIANRVFFTGVVARDDVAKIAATFDIALQPEVTSYASPLKLFEYMAMGHAIVAPTVPTSGRSCRMAMTLCYLRLETRRHSPRPLRALPQLRSSGESWDTRGEEHRSKEPDVACQRSQIAALASKALHTVRANDAMVPNAEPA